MGLFKRSSRDMILSDISFHKKGQILSSGNPSTGGSAGHSTGSGGGKSSLAKFFMVGLLLFGLIVAGVFAYGYLGSSTGQRAVKDIGSTINQWTLQPISDFFSRISAQGSGDYFSSNINSSSSKKGIDLVDFHSITGKTIPAGQAFDLLYGIQYYNVPSSSIYDGDFSCYFNTSKKDASPNERRDGHILPENPTTIRKGATTTCRISGEQTADLKDTAYTLFGSFTFVTETKDASMPVYFIPGDVADQLGDQDFFTAYDLGIRQSDLRVVYNGEPISLAMGVGGEGAEEQPVIVRRGDTLSYNTLAITLRNEWNGNIAGLDSLSLYLPDGVSLDDTLNGGPTVSCPFIAAGSGNRANTYIMEDAVKDSLFQNYISTNSFFGREKYHTFQCWISVDPNIFSDAPYVVKEYKVDARYQYTVEQQQETVSIIPQGESLVVE